MNINFHQSSILEGEIVIELAEEDYMPSVAESIRNYRSKSEIKGFRRGQAPVSIIQKMYGQEILLRATLSLATQNINSYLQAHRLTLLQDPIMVSNTLSAARVNIAHPGTIEIKFICGLKPEIDLSPIQQIEVDQFKITSVSDDTVTNIIKKIQIKYGTTQEVMQAEAGDIIYSSLTTENKQGIYLPAEGIKIDKEYISFVGFRPHDKLTLHFSPSYSYSLPNTVLDYYEQTIQILENLTGTYEITVEKIYRNVPAELTPDFFLNAFADQEALTFEELKNRIKDILILHAQSNADNLLAEDLKQALLNHLSFELPAESLKKRLSSRFPDWDEEDIQAYYYQHTEDSLRWSLIIDKVIQEYDIHVSPTEIAEYLQLPSPSNFTALEQLIRTIRQPFASGNLDQPYKKLYYRLMESKALHAVQDKIKIHSQDKTVEEFNEIMAHRSEDHPHDHND